MHASGICYGFDDEFLIIHWPILKAAFPVRSMLCKDVHLDGLVMPYAGLLEPQMNPTFEI